MTSNYLKVNKDSKSFLSNLKSLSQSDSSGIYKLYYFAEGKPKTIQRLFAEDTDGLLYIGMTEGPLHIRVGNLQKALYDNSKKDELGPASSGHTQMGKKYYRIRRKINIDDLYIQVFSKDNPKKAETDAIEHYVSQFAELPPLNGQYGSFEPVWDIFQQI